MDGLHRHILATIVPGLSMDWVTGLDGAERRDHPHWCTAELQRVAGLHLLKAGDVDGARAQLEYAHDTAMRQSAVGWELRAATSLAELDMQEGSLQIAHARLSNVLGRINGGAKTADVKTAKNLLARLS